MHEEIYKQHPYLLCKVSNIGNVKYLDDTIARKINSRYISYNVADIYGKSSPKLAHRLVIETFMGDIPNNMHINHKDGDRHNNSIGNLEIVTPSENLKHAVENGLLSVKKGENHPSSILTEEKVLTIYELFKKGIQDSIISESFGISYKLVNLLRRGKRWKHLFYQHFTAPLPSVSLKVMSLEKALELLSELSIYDNRTIADKYNIDISSVYRIRNKQTWKNVWFYYDNVSVQRLSNAHQIDGSK